MRTFDTSLFDLYNEGLISFDEAIRNADSANELRLNIKLRGRPRETDNGLALEPVAEEKKEEEAA
jgi:twitching motility protein PilU